jgi:hypothetical protein
MMKCYRVLIKGGFRTAYECARHQIGCHFRSTEEGHNRGTPFYLRWLTLVVVLQSLNQSCLQVPFMECVLNQVQYQQHTEETEITHLITQTISIILRLSISVYRWASSSVIFWYVVFSISFLQGPQRQFSIKEASGQIHQTTRHHEPTMLENKLTTNMGGWIGKYVEFLSVRVDTSIHCHDERVSVWRKKE